MYIYTLYYVALLIFVLEAQLESELENFMYTASEVTFQKRVSCTGSVLTVSPLLTKWSGE
jgi:hypothetical protein